MGLPQVSSGGIAEEVAASLSTFVQASSRIVNVSSCDLSGMHGGNLGNRMQADMTCSSFGDFPRKIIAELPSSDAVHMYKDGKFNTFKLKNGSMEQNGWLTSRSGQSIQSPLPKIVGFESKALNSVADNAAAVTGLLARKRVLSPLSQMLSSDQFDGGTLHIDEGTYQSGFEDKNDPYTFVMPQEHKKAHISNFNNFNSPNWSPFASPEWKCLQEDNHGDNSNTFTGASFLRNKEVPSHDNFTCSSACNYSREPTKERSSTGAITIPKKMAGSPPLSLSPLGPRFPKRIEPSGRYRDVTKDSDDNYITLKDMKQSLDGTFSGIFSSQKDEDLRTLSKSLDSFDSLEKKFDLFTPEAASGTRWHWGQDSDLSPQCVKLIRSVSGLPVRRSLVGSFEESLLSGRLLSGKISQRIDGFLAVLNVTGGNFSPKCQKLPFAVNSIDGDKYLLYYSSINLSGNLPSNKCGGPKLKRSLSSSDSQAENNRLRIPMKGRIQLVLSNPEKTPIHSFLCNYDLSDMPVGTKTFIRQKITLASCAPTSTPINGRCQDSEIKNCVKASSASNVSHSLPIRGEFSKSSKPAPVQRSPYRSTKETETEGSGSEGKHATHCCGFNGSEYENTGGKDNSILYCQGNVNESVNSPSKVNKNTSGSGVLRYALHLRFLCPFPKRYSRSFQRCKSDPSCAPAVTNKDTEEERRFYLYGDMRAVFPQRHSDADEGELHVEYDFPSEPKYFDISN